MEQCQFLYSSSHKRCIIHLVKSSTTEAHTQHHLYGSLCNKDLTGLWSITFFCIDVKNSFDHYLITFYFTKDSTSCSPSFRLKKMWLPHSDGVHIIREVWNQNIRGCSMFVLFPKLKTLKMKLRAWNNHFFVYYK